MNQDIKITGINEQMSMHGAGPREDIYLDLSEQPSPTWASLFLEEHRKPRMIIWYTAKVYDRYIVVHCKIGDFTQQQLDFFKEDVRNTNTKYRTQDTQRWQQETKQQEAVQRQTQSDQSLLAHLRATLNFDD